MFRVASEFVPTPFYMLVCDDPRCATMFQHPLPTDTPANPEQAAIRAAQADGWLMSFGRQLCPGHFKQLKDIAAKSDNLIVVPQVGMRQ